MKILYHHRTVSKDGMDVHIRELLAALERRGHEARVVAPEAAEGSEFGSESRLVAAVRRLLPNAVSECLELAYSHLAYRRLREAYLAFGPDVLYERYNLFLLAGLHLKRRYGLPLLLEVNSPLMEERRRYGGLALVPLARWAERRVWRGADVVLVVSHELANRVREAGVDPDRIVVTPNGVDRRRFVPNSPKRGEVRRELGLDGKLVLGFTGFVRPWHGLDRALDVLAGDPGERPLHLLVVGDGPARAEIEARARSLGVADRVTFLGIVPRERVGDCVAAFDIALQPSAVPYASPLKMLEYMAVGCAIVAPDQPNIRELLENEVSGLLFDPETPAAFTEAIDRLARDGALRRRLGEAAAAAIDARGLTWDENARVVEGLASRLSAGGSPAAGQQPLERAEKRAS